MLLRCCGVVCDRVGDSCGGWRARSAVPFPVSSDPWGGAACCACWLLFRGGRHSGRGAVRGGLLGVRGFPLCGLLVGGVPGAGDVVGGAGDAGGEGGEGVGVGDCAAGGAVGEGGIGDSVGEGGAGIVLVDGEVYGSAGHCCRLEHPGGTSSRGRHPLDRSIWGQVAARRPGRAHPGRNKEQGQPPPGLEHQRTSGGRTPRSGSSGVEQAARAAAPQAGLSRDKGRPDAPDWNIRGGTGSRSHCTHDTKVEGHEVGRRPGLEHLGRNKQERPQPPGPRNDGVPPRAGIPGADQLEGVPTPRAGASRGKWRPEAKETGGRDQGGAAKETRPEATQRTRPKKMQGGREVDEAEGTQGSKDEEGAVVQQRNRPMGEAGVMQRSSREDKGGVQQRNRDQDEAAERWCNHGEEKVVVMQ